MPKIPNFSKLTEKFDLQGIVSSVKSVINPGSAIPEHLEGDPVAAKLALIVTATHNMANLHEQLEQEMAKINMLIASIYKDLEANQVIKEPDVTSTKSDKK